ncbi:MAG: hypothetical protein ONB27_11975 [candidate division KSB1 bacterium]|nr:hypothetical protein [candidate division KSB1 bacterium]
MESKGYQLLTKQLQQLCWICGAVIALLMLGCASTSLKSPASDTVSSSSVGHLPGIDSTVAKSAYEFSNRLLVDSDRRIKAREWYNNAMISYHWADSILSLPLTIRPKDSTLIAIYHSWLKSNGTPNNDEIDLNSSATTLAEQMVAKILNRAQQQAQQAKILNPYDLEIRGLLAQIYIKQGAATHNSISYHLALDELNNLLLVDRSNPLIYEKLAECYYALNDWQRSYQHFQQAEQILLIQAQFRTNIGAESSVAIDTTRWIYYLRSQGETKAKLYDAEQAIYYLNKAGELTRDEAVHEELNKYIRWIKWDDGNIRASELRDAVIKIEQQGDLRKARGQYLELLPLLKTLRARNEINWKIASIEFNSLKRKDAALRRMFQVVQQIQRQDQPDELNQIYLKDYAAMCYSVGLDYLRDYQFRFAYMYLDQASQYDWDHRADCYYQLALLSQANPAETIRNCKKALEFVAQLSADQVKKINKMLAISYLRMGQFDMAQSYYQTLTQNQLFLEN